MTGKMRQLVKTRTSALVLASLSLLCFVFAASPLGDRYGDSVDYYVGLVFIALVAVVSLWMLQAWWAEQQGLPQPLSGRRKTRLARLINWWRHWTTDWDWTDVGKK